MWIRGWIGHFFMGGRGRFERAHMGSLSRHVHSQKLCVGFHGRCGGLPQETRELLQPPHGLPRRHVGFFSLLQAPSGIYILNVSCCFLCVGCYMLQNAAFHMRHFPAILSKHYVRYAITNYCARSSNV